MVKLQKYFIVLSNQTYKDIKTINPHAEIEIIPNGIILPEKIKKRTKLKHILSIGRLEINQKGIDLLLKAYKKLLPKKPPPLIIAGNGSSAQNAALKKLVLRLHLQKYVHLIGRVEGTKKDQLFRESYCIVLPSRFETFSLTALESIAHGKPLVCFDIPGLRWIPDHLCLKVNKFNIDQLQNSIHKAYSDKKFKQTLAVNAPIFIKHFEWRTIALRYQKVIFHHLGYEQTHPLDYTK